MWYSNDQPTPTKFRQRTYTIVCDNDLTEEDFELYYKWPIRSINSQWPTCNFVIAALSNADSRVEKYLRELGISPARITIYHMDSQIPENKYRSATKEYTNRLELEKDMVKYSSHDILYVAPYVVDGMAARFIKFRAEKQKTNPFIETMPDV